MRRMLPLIGLLAMLPLAAGAHVPVREAAESREVVAATQIGLDPSVSSIALYGAISAPDEVDIYEFTVQENASLPIEALVPVRQSHAAFHPAIIVAGREFPPFEREGVDLPEEYGAIEIPAPDLSAREVFFEPFSQERLYHGNERDIDVLAGESYLVYLFDPNRQAGDYSLGIGVKENFEEVSFVGLLAEVGLIKLGLIGGKQIPWGDLIGLFLMLAGFIIGLGAVTVIDIHGFLGRKSSYWTIATTRTHKVTKPLIWIGIGLVALGMGVFHRETGWTGLVPIQAIVIATLILNGIFLSFVVSPRLIEREKAGKDKKLLPAALQRKIAMSFIVSFLGWWSLLASVVWSLIMLR